jgi:hypothetical protein
MLFDDLKKHILSFPKVQDRFAAVITLIEMIGKAGVTVDKNGKNFAALAKDLYPVYTVAVSGAYKTGTRRNLFKASAWKTASTKLSAKVNKSNDLQTVAMEEYIQKVLDLVNNFKGIPKFDTIIVQLTPESLDKEIRERIKTLNKYCQDNTITNAHFPMTALEAIAPSSTVATGSTAAPLLLSTAATQATSGALATADGPATASASPTEVPNPEERKVTVAKPL